MKTTKTVVVPAKENKEPCIVCDFCGETSCRPTANAGVNRWGDNGTSKNTCMLSSISTKDRYSTTHGVVTYVDICPECFKTRVLPWLEEQKVVIHQTEFTRTAY